ncbi:MAG TPA: rhodanese-like domain-containing protein [Lapillicoccus sp.]|nr:rhodanese-like domain-containing protein [Lapillicoccus sp.]
MSRSEHLLAVDNLSQSLSSVRLLDVRWRLGDGPGEGRQRYAEGHLPGARYLDLESVLTAHTGDPLDGRHPLPDIATLTAGLEEVGVEVDDDVVVYDEPGSFAAERAWWVLRWAGLRPRVLDGGLSAWVEAGLPLEAGLAPDVAASTPGRASRLDLSVGHLPTIDVDQAAAFPERGTLIDARGEERYRGEMEPIDPRPGHIPGAVNVPATELYENGRMPSDDRLRELFESAVSSPGTRSADADPAVAAYCGSGVSAARDILALAVLGADTALFPGSWSAWSNDPRRPAARGRPAGG